MSENVWLGGGTAYQVDFKTSAKGKLYLTCSLGVYDSYDKSTMYLRIMCFDDYICDKLQKVFKDRDYIRVEGILKYKYDKETKISSTHIQATKIFYLGAVDFKTLPQMTYTSTAGKNAYEVTTDKEVVNAVGQDEVPF